MTAPKFTPGPWSVDADANPEMVYAGIGSNGAYRYVADCLSDYTSARIARDATANARLIAAAPDLYEALRDAAQLLIDCAARMPPGTERLMARVGAALGKAVSP